MSIEASTSTPVLLACLKQVLVPKPQRVKPDAILVMDNLRPHRATEVRELLARAGIELVYLPRYSPEFNPVEHAWAKMQDEGAAQGESPPQPGGVGSRTQTRSRHHHRSRRQRLVQARWLCLTLIRNPL